MDLYRIRRYNVDKEKTFLYVIIALITLLLCTTISTCVYKYKYDRLVSEHRQQLELYRTKSEQYENTYRRARETNSELGKCLSESVTTLSGLRQQISEIRTRYEKMEELLSSDGRYNFDSGNINNSTPNDTCGEINK